MHTFRLIAAAALLPVFAAAQAAAPAAKQTFKLIYASTDQDANEIMTSVRTIADIGKVAIDNPRQFTAEGTADQLRTADWIVRQLDIPPAATGGNDVLRGIADTHGEDTARVFFLPPTLTVQEFNEVMTAARTITDIRRVFGYSSRRAIVLRDTEEATTAADWLLAEMMRDSSTGELIFPKKVANPKEIDNHVRVFRVPRTATPQDFNEVMTMVRTLTDTRRVFGYQQKREIVVRGTTEQVAASDWLLAQLNRDLPMKSPQVSEAFPAPYQVSPNQPSEKLQLFYFTGTDSNQTLVDRATAMKAQAGVRRIFYTATPRVLAVGGTADQLAKIELIARQ